MKELGFMKHFKNSISVRTFNRILAALSIGLCLALSPSASYGQALNEDQLKASYILGFKDFIHWQKNDKTPIVIGIVGEGFIFDAISDTITTKNAKAGEVLFEVVKVNRIEDLKGVDVLYFSEKSEGIWQDYLTKACELGVLTIADGSGFLKAGGLISFEIRKNRLHFRLNYEASQECGIKFSSKLSKLAVG